VLTNAPDGDFSNDYFDLIWNRRADVATTGPRRRALCLVQWSHGRGRVHESHGYGPTNVIADILPGILKTVSPTQVDAGDVIRSRWSSNAASAWAMPTIWW